MPRNLNNWTYWDVKGFLHKKGFRLVHSRGSHMYFLRSEGKNPKENLVCVPFHGSKSIHTGTLKSIIAQSGIDRKKWLNN